MSAEPSHESLRLGAMVEDFRSLSESNPNLAHAALNEIAGRADLRLRLIAAALVGRGGKDFSADDVLQTAWAERILTALQPGRPPIADSEHFFALAVTAIGQTIKDLRRRAARLKRRAPSERPAPPSRTDRTEDVKLDLYAAVERLPKRDRAVVLLRLEGLSRAETAERLGITERTVKRSFQRSRTALARSLPGYRSGPC